VVTGHAATADHDQPHRLCTVAHGNPFLKAVHQATAKQNRWVEKLKMYKARNIQKRPIVLSITISSEYSQSSSKMLVGER
jgi:hypothetical protein